MGLGSSTKFYSHIPFWDKSDNNNGHFREQPLCPCEHFDHVFLNKCQGEKWFEQNLQRNMKPSYIMSTIGFPRDLELQSCYNINAFLNVFINRMEHLHTKSNATNMLSKFYFELWSKTFIKLVIYTRNKYNYKAYRLT